MARDGEEPRVLAVIPHFSAQRDILETVVAAVAGQRSDAHVEILVVANNRFKVPEVSSTRKLKVHLLRPPFNTGYAGALELGRKLEGFEFLWVIQEDNVPEPDCLGELLNEIEKLDVGKPVAMVSPFHRTGPGMKKRRFRGQVWDIRSGTRTGGLGEEALVDRLTFSDWSLDQAPFLYLSGALIRQSAMEEIGGFDVGFWPKSFVDADTGFRLLKGGFAIVLSFRARFAHLVRPLHSQHPTDWENWSLKLNKRKLLSKHRQSPPVSSETFLNLDAGQALSLAAGLADFVEFMEQQRVVEQSNEQIRTSQDLPGSWRRPSLGRLGRLTRRWHEWFRSGI